MPIYMKLGTTIKTASITVVLCVCHLIVTQIVHANTIIYGATAYGLTDIVEIDLTNQESQKVGDIAFKTQAMEQDPETGYVYYFEWKTTGDEFAYWDPATNTNTIVRNYSPAPG